MSYREPDWKALYLIEQKCCNEHHQKAEMLERQLWELRDDRKRRRAEKIFNAIVITFVLSVIGGITGAGYAWTRNRKDRPNAEVISAHQKAEAACEGMAAIIQHESRCP